MKKNDPRLGRPVEILLVEDSPSDADLSVEAFGSSKVATHLNIVTDGEQAMKFLRKKEPYAKAPRPDLILLDLNLPRKDGREVLAEIKTDVMLRTIPVIVMTTSPADRDVWKAYDLHANCYIIKPLDFRQFVELIKGIEAFWLTLARLPPHEAKLTVS